MKTLSEKAKKVRDYIKKDIVIAHRGSTYWTPEETEPAFWWERNSRWQLEWEIFV